MNSGILKFTAAEVHDVSRFCRQMAVITDPQGKILDMVPVQEAGEDIRVCEGLLCPGFINTHCHLELSHMKGLIPEGTGLVDFLISVMQCRGAAPETISAAAAEADRQMGLNGIMATGDISNTTDSIGVKRKSPLYYHTFVETIGFSAAGAAERMQHSLGILQQFREAGLTASVAPHAPYSVSSSLFGLINAHESQATITIHNQECAAEDALFMGTGSDFLRLYEAARIPYRDFQPTRKSSLESWLPYFHPGRSLILVHNTFTSDADIAFAQNSGYRLHWCLCPNANLYIEGRMPPVDMLRKHGVSIVLGTDSLASNHVLSILEEVKTLQRHCGNLPLEEMLSWATRNGARALDCGGVGSFEKGGRPGLLHLHPLTRDAAGALRLAEDAKAERLI